MKFIHITDPHLTEPGQILWGTDPCDRRIRVYPCGDLGIKWSKRGNAATVFCE